MQPTVEQIGEVLTSFAETVDSELLALDESAVFAQWCWRGDDGQGIEWNTYKFSDMLEIHKRRWRRWEEHHNGRCCVVERVRDKYVMPRVREFLAALATHNAKAQATAGASAQVAPAQRLRTVNPLTDLE